MSTWTAVLLVLIGALIVLPAAAYMTARMVTWGILTARWRFREFKRWSQRESEELDGDEKRT